MSVDIVGDVSTLQTLFLGDGEVALHLAVKSVSHQFEGDIAVAVDSRILSLSRKQVKYLVDICHVEVAAQAEVLCTPVVATQERVYIFKSAFACCGVAQVTHVELSQESGLFFRFVVVGAVELVGDGGENLCDGFSAFGFLAEHILRTRFAFEADASHAGAFLTTVVLFLHHEIQFVESVSLRAILLLVVFKRFQQANHRYATFMFEGFHVCLVCCE